MFEDLRITTFHGEIVDFEACRARKSNYENNAFVVHDPNKEYTQSDWVASYLRSGMHIVQSEVVIDTTEC